MVANTVFCPSKPLFGAKSVPSTLTELAIKNTELPASGTLTLWDGALKNFGCRVSPKGTKSFIVLLGKGRRHTIGRYPILSLAEARAAAKRALAEKTLGKIRPNTSGYLTAVEEFLSFGAQRAKSSRYGRPSTGACSHYISPSERRDLRTSRLIRSKSG